MEHRRRSTGGLDTARSLSIENDWTALPVHRKWYYFLRVLLIVNRRQLPAIIALLLVTAGVLTWSVGENVLYGMFMLALGAVIVLALFLSRPNNK